MELTELLKEVPNTDDGRYFRPMLNHVFGSPDRYRVITCKVGPDFANNFEKVRNLVLNSSEVAIANQTDSTFTAIVPKDETDQGWMKVLHEAGIRIIDGPKTPKRLTALTKTTGLFLLRDARDEDELLRVIVVPDGAFSDYSIGDMVDDLTDDPAMTEVRARQVRELTAGDMEKMTDAANVVADWAYEGMIVQMRDSYSLRHRESVRKYYDKRKAIAADEDLSDAVKEVRLRTLGKPTNFNPHDVDVLCRELRDNLSGSFRLIYEDGEAKGDYIVGQTHHMRDALEARGLVPPKDEDPDKRPIAAVIVAANLKDEVRWIDGSYMLLEPSGSNDGDDAQPEITTRGTDTQTLTWMNDWLYTHQNMYRATSDWLNLMVKKLEQGEFPKFFTNIQALEDNVSTVDVFQRQALRFQRDGLGIDHSIFLTQRIIHGVIQKMKAKTSDLRTPIPHAMYVHVATDSWLKMSGRQPEDWPNKEGYTPRGHVWFDKVTHRMVYNDVDFVEDYERHGGWDLDDALRAHRRVWRNVDVWVNVRSPNSYGEYSIRRYIPGTFQPQFLTDADQKKSKNFNYPELPYERPAFIEECDIDFKFTSLVDPDGDMEDYVTHPNKDVLDAEEQQYGYTRRFLATKIDNAGAFFGLFGRYVNIQMIEQAYYGTYNAYQLAQLEEVVDVCTQRQNSMAHKLISDDIIERRQALVDASYEGQPIDEFLWKRRSGFGRSAKLSRGWFSRMQLEIQNVVSSAVTRVSQMDREIADRIPDEVLELGKKYNAIGTKLVQRYMDIMISTMEEFGGDKSEYDSRELHGILNDSIVTAIMQRAKTEQDVYDIVLSVARACYSRPRNTSNNTYSDTPLFAHTATVGNYSMSDLYIAALQYYDIPTWMNAPMEWSGYILCACGDDDLRLFSCESLLQLQHACPDDCKPMIEYSKSEEVF